MQKTKFLFLDLEMTGLDARCESIIEVAAVVTDAQLNPLAEPFEALIKPKPEYLAAMQPFVLDLHKKSGILDEVEQHGQDLALVYQAFLDYLAQFKFDPKNTYLAGNSIYKDREFLVAYMPKVLELLHYRLVDVSTLKTLVRLWMSEDAAFKKQGKHRALDDVYATIEELKRYRALLFKA